MPKPADNQTEESRPIYVRQFDSQLLMPERIAAMCEDLFKQLACMAARNRK